MGVNDKGQRSRDAAPDLRDVLHVVRQEPNLIGLDSVPEGSLFNQQHPDL